ncbi:MAG: sulfatase-like hydrolase/transferase [Phycisphaerae bacterium]
MTDESTHQNQKRSPWGWIIPVLIMAAGVLLWATRSNSNDPTKPVVLADVVEPGDAKGFNVVLVTLDTTRLDHLGFYGRENAHTPNLDSLLEHGVRFDDAVTSASTTLASHTTMMTGLYPPTSGVRDNGIYKLAEDHVTLAETLRAEGYATGAFVSSFVLDPRFGLDQGFDTYEFKTDRRIQRGPASLEHERRANDVTASAVDWLRSHSKKSDASPYFLWVHISIHTRPYDSPLRSTSKNKLSPYAAEIAFVDREFGRLLKAIDKHGGREKTLIVVISDHGEGLGDHEEEQHGIFIYDSTVHAAFVLSNPTLFPTPSRVDDRVVGTVDFLPTVCDLVGIKPPVELDGVSQVTTDANADRAIYVETLYPLNLGCSPLHGLRTHGAKFIYAPRPELYDLKKDPGELNNLFGSVAGPLATLQGRLTDMLKRWPDDQVAPASSTPLSAEDRRRLTALGCLSGSSTTDVDSLPDPKDRIAEVNAMGEVVRLLTEERFEDALSLAKEMIDGAGDWTTPTLMAAEALMRMDRQSERVDVLEAYCKRNPTPEMLYYLAHALLAAHRYDDCAERLDLAERLDPGFGAIPALRGDLLMAQYKYDEAIAEYEKAIRIDPDRLPETVMDSLQQARKLLSRGTP